MPPDTKPKIVAVPNLGNIAFPPGMSDADINAAITQHLTKVSAPGAMQSRPGGPIFTAPGTPQQGSLGTDVKDAAVEGALGLSSGFTGMPESQTPVKDFHKGLTRQVQEQGQHPFINALKMLLDPTAGALPAAAGMAGNAVGAGKEFV